MADQYIIGERIGVGSFGQVFKGVEVATGRAVALKTVDLENADDEIEVIQREIAVLATLNTPHVVSYIASYTQNATLTIVMEYLSHGSVRDLLDALPGRSLPEEVIAAILAPLAAGLAYVHGAAKLHRDVKAANVLLGGGGEVKLADFGVAGTLTATLKQRNTFVGSTYWMAPEVVSEDFYAEKADIWSFGITAIEMAVGAPPYSAMHPLQALMPIVKNDPPRLPPTFSKSFQEFVASCLQKRPEQRRSASSLLSHPFLKRGRPAALRDLLARVHPAVPLAPPPAPAAAPPPCGGSAAAPASVPVASSTGGEDVLSSGSDAGSVVHLGSGSDRRDSDAMHRGSKNSDEGSGCAAHPVRGGDAAPGGGEVSMNDPLGWSGRNGLGSSAVRAGDDGAVAGAVGPGLVGGRRHSSAERGGANVSSWDFGAIVDSLPDDPVTDVGGVAVPASAPPPASAGGASGPLRGAGESSNTAWATAAAAKTRQLPPRLSNGGAVSSPRGGSRSPSSGAPAPPLLPAHPASSAVLQSLLLPAIARLRSAAAASSSGGLMEVLGRLEVDLVDAETAAPGAATALVEAIVRDGVGSDMDCVRRVVEDAARLGRRQEGGRESPRMSGGDGMGL
ncbi:hypothetical protein MMPV_003464 [Pyropia vietnamensis]